MAKFVKIPVTIDAERWFRNGDHSEDGEEDFKNRRFKEGKIVSYFRRSDVSGGKE